MKIYGIVDCKIASLAYASYSFIIRKEVFLCSKSMYMPSKLTKPVWLIKFLRYFDVSINEPKGTVYDLKDKAISDSFFKRYDLDNNLFIKGQIKMFNTLRVINYYKQKLAVFHFAFLRDIHHVNYIKDGGVFVLPKLKRYRILSDSLLNKKQYSFSHLLTVIFLLLSLGCFFKTFLSLLLIRPVFKSVIKKKLLQEIIRGFTHEIWKDDRYIDNKTLFYKDVCFFYDGRHNKRYFNKAFEEAPRLNYQLLDIGNNRFNVISKSFLMHLLYNVVLGPFCFILLLVSCRCLILYYASFLAESERTLRLFSFIQPLFYSATDEGGGITNAIFAPKLGCKTILLANSCAGGPSFSVLNPFLCHNIFFVWGKTKGNKKYKYTINDQVYGIGCFMSNIVPDRTKEEILSDLGLNKDKQIVLFFDNQYGSNEFTDVFHEFIETMVIYAKHHRDVQVILRSKRPVESDKQMYKKIFEDLNIKVLINKDIFIGSLIRISSVCVGIGLRDALKIALFIGAKGIYYDQTGCFSHPFKKYEGTLVIRDRTSLFRRIDGLLKGEVKMPVIPELQELNIRGTDPFAIVRRYIATGKIDDRYRIH